MTDKPERCQNYTPWTDHGLQITQCLEFWEGQCGESLSPHYKQVCPWVNGYPCSPATGEGTWKAPEQTLMENVGKMDTETEDWMSEPIKIEPYYRHQGKQLVDCLFDKGLLSETLSRDGMDNIEELLALYLQQGAESAAKCAELTKKYKARRKPEEGEDLPRHEEEMRWIARAREAEAKVAELEAIFPREDRAAKAWEWSREVGDFLKEILAYKANAYSRLHADASRLFIQAIALGIVPEPDCRPGKTWEVNPEDCHPPTWGPLLPHPPGSAPEKG